MVAKMGKKLVDLMELLKVLIMVVLKEGEWVSLSVG